MADKTPTKKKWIVRGVSFDPETFDALQAEAEKQERTVSWMIRKAVQDFWIKRKGKSK